MNTTNVLVCGNVPLYASEQAAGADLFAHIDEPITLNPLERILIPTNTYLAIPEGFEGQVRSRSGLSIKHGITIINSPGTIDSDYRGEIKVPIINLGQEEYVISHGDKIAQLIIAPFIKANFIETSIDSLPSTRRGSGGFGSTGV